MGITEDRCIEILSNLQKHHSYTNITSANDFSVAKEDKLIPEEWGYHQTIRALRYGASKGWFNADWSWTPWGVRKRVWYPMWSILNRPDNHEIMERIEKGGQ